MRFLIDAQLPRALARYLTEIGHDVLHVKDLPKGGDTTDSEIARYADQNDYVVVSKDSDFRNLHTQGRYPKRLLWITAPNLRNSKLIALFSEHGETITSAFDVAAFVELQEDRVLLHRPPTDLVRMRAESAAIAEDPAELAESKAVLNEMRGIIRS
jgi:predicted nuclease of predicted toxin-antitoxin system